MSNNLDAPYIKYKSKNKWCLIRLVTHDPLLLTTWNFSVLYYVLLATKENVVSYLCLNKPMLCFKLIYLIMKSEQHE